MSLRLFLDFSLPKTTFDFSFIHIVFWLYYLPLTFYNVSFLIHNSDNSLSIWSTLSSILFNKNTWVFFLRCCKLEHIFFFCNFLAGNTIIESQKYFLEKKNMQVLLQLFHFMFQRKMKTIWICILLHVTCFSCLEVFFYFSCFWLSLSFKYQARTCPFVVTSDKCCL